MKSRIASVFTVAALLGGTGGAIAIAGTGSSGGSNGGAASGEYKPGKGCGDKNHKHARHNECKKDDHSGDKDDHGTSGSDKGKPNNSKGEAKPVSNSTTNSSKGNSGKK